MVFVIKISLSVVIYYICYIDDCGMRNMIALCIKPLKKRKLYICTICEKENGSNKISTFSTACYICYSNNISIYLLSLIFFSVTMTHRNIQKTLDNYNLDAL